MRILWLAFTFILCRGADVYGQFSMEGYLANAISDEELEFTRAKQEFLEENKFNSPIIREVEFRARVRNFGNGFEDYRLRFSPLNPFEKKANKDYHKALGDQIATEYRMNLEEVLLSRYLLMIEHMELSRLIDHLEASAIFYERVLATTKNQSSSSALKDYIQLDKTHLKTILRLEKARQNRDLIEQTIRYTYSFNSPIAWQPEKVIATDSIRNWLVSENPNLENNLYLKNELDKGTVDALEYKVEKNESFRNLGYVQAEYRVDEDRNFGENLGMQIAVNIPIVNPDKPDLQRDKMELFEENKKLEIERKELERYIETHKTKLVDAFKRLDILSEKSLAYQQSTFTSSNSNNALDLMIELHAFKSELKQFEIEARSEILSLYIELLSLNGQLSEQPYTNYLSRAGNNFDLAY